MLQNHTISTVLLQAKRPIAFFSRTVKSSDRIRPSIEKEAMAIVEPIMHWRHFLLSRHFTLITDQQAVAFIFDKKRWRTVKERQNSSLADRIVQLQL